MKNDLNLEKKAVEWTAVDLMVALDFSSPEEALAWINRLESQIKNQIIYKIGLELFISAGPGWVKKRVEEGRRIFLDLKLYDIPNTVSKAVSGVCDLGVEFLTIHLSGGEEMIRKSIEIIKLKSSPLKLLGVSVLTSFSEKDEEYQFLEKYLKRAENTDIFGIVCSAKDLNKANQICPKQFKVTPGIRLNRDNIDDQKRVMTPKDAKKLGSNAIVVGRPIFDSSHPEKIIEEILQQLL